LLSFTIIYISIYFIIWLIFMLINKKHVEEINERLKKS